MTRRRVLTLGRIAVVIAIFAVLLVSGRLEPGRIASALAQPMFAVVIGLQATLTLINLGRWVFLVRRRAPEVSRRRVWVAAFRAQFTTLALPAVGGGDAVRVGSLKAIPPQVVAGTVISDRVLALLGLGIALSTSVGWAFWSGRGPRLAPILPFALLVIMGVVAVPPMLVLASRLLRSATKPLWVKIHQATTVALDGLSPPPTLMVALALSVFSMLLNAASLAAALIACGSHDVGPAFVVSPLITLATALPITPQGLGVTETTSAWLFGTLEMIGGAEAIVLGRLAWITVTLFTGVAWLVDEDASPRDAV